MPIFTACSTADPVSVAPSVPSRYKEPTLTGTIRSDEITESSGLAASKCQPDVLWTHNDSGDDAFIFAIRTNGDLIGTWRVPNAQNEDWEDIASTREAGGQCFIYVSETGNNKRLRHSHIIYKIPEPVIPQNVPPSSRKEPLYTAEASTIKFRYPDPEHDAEAMMVKASTGHIYIVTKEISGPAGVYRLKPLASPDQEQVAERLTSVSVPSIPNGLITGGDISPDGQHVILCDYSQAYEYTLPTGTTDFDEIWKQEPQVVNIGKRKTGESIAYSADGRSLYAGSEGRNSPVYRIDLR